MSEDEMTDSIKGSKDSVTKYSQGTEGVTVTELPSSSLYSQQTSRGAWNQKVLQAGKQM